MFFREWRFFFTKYGLKKIVYFGNRRFFTKYYYESTFFLENSEKKVNPIEFFGPKNSVVLTE